MEYNPTSSHMATGWASYTYQNPDLLEQYQVYGPVIVRDPNGIVPSQLSSMRAGTLTGKGTTAIARCKPTNHVSNVANDLYEIRQGQLPELPGRRLWKDKVSRARNIGHEYLNKEFGWEPLVADIHSACYAAVNSHRLLEEYENNSGKAVRRSYAYPSESSVTSADAGPWDGYCAPALGRPAFVDGGIPQPHLLIQTKLTVETWFSGSFTYYIPGVYTARNGVSRAAFAASHLLGLEPTPEVIWQCAPWTWALDWFSNAGDCVSILSDMAVDGLVLNYGYIMEHLFYEITYALDAPSRFRDIKGGRIPAAPIHVYYESKRRQAATPFGFEVGWQGLSLRQMAITAALGLTKLRF
jgi:hypothetical protein